MRREYLSGQLAFCTDSSYNVDIAEETIFRI
jgi:hypothetical protein